MSAVGAIIEARWRLDRAIHELHQAELELRRGLAGAEARARALREEVTRLRDELAAVDAFPEPTAPLADRMARPGELYDRAIDLILGEENQPPDGGEEE